MSKLEKMFESPIFAKLQEWGGKVQSNKVIASISNGMMAIMSLVLAGAAFMIIATLLNVAGVLETTDQVYQWLCVPYNMTMGLISLPIAFAVGYSYSNALGMKGAMANGLVTMILFLMVAAPSQSVTLGESTATMIPTQFLGGPGIFVAMFLPIISVRIIKFCKDKNATIKMPDSIPPYLVDSFANIVPLVINLVLWEGLSILCQVLMNGATLPALIMGIISIPLSGLTSTPRHVRPAGDLHARLDSRPARSGYRLRRHPAGHDDRLRHQRRARRRRPAHCVRPDLHFHAGHLRRRCR